MVKITFLQRITCKISSPDADFPLMSVGQDFCSLASQQEQCCIHPCRPSATPICPFNSLLEFSEYSRVHQVYIPSGLLLLELYRYLTPQKSQGKRGEILSMFNYRHYRTDQFPAFYQTAPQLYLIQKIFQ